MTPTTVSSRSVRVALTVTALLLLAGCGAPADPESTSTPSPTPVEKGSGKVTVVAEDDFDEIKRFDGLDDGQGGTVTCFVFKGAKRGGMSCPEHLAKPADATFD